LLSSLDLKFEALKDIDFLSRMLKGEYKTYHQDKAKILLALGHWSEAAKVLANDPNNDDLLHQFKTALLLYHSKNYAASLEKFRIFNAKYGETHFYMGLCLSRMAGDPNNKAQAKEEFQKAIEENNALAYIELGLLENEEKSESFFVKAERIDASSFLKQALLSYVEQNFDESLKFFDRAIKSKPEHPAAYLQKGIVLSLMGRYKEAINCFDKAKLYSGKNPRIAYEKGYALMKLERYQEAIQCLNDSLKQILPEENSNIQMSEQNYLKTNPKTKINDEHLDVSHNFSAEYLQEKKQNLKSKKHKETLIKDSPFGDLISEKNIFSFSPVNPHILGVISGLSLFSLPAEALWARNVYCQLYCMLKLGQEEKAKNYYSKFKRLNNESELFFEKGYFLASLNDDNAKTVIKSYRKNLELISPELKKEYFDSSMGRSSNNKLLQENDIRLRNFYFELCFVIAHAHLQLEEIPNALNYLDKLLKLDSVWIKEILKEIQTHPKSNQQAIDWYFEKYEKICTENPKHVHELHVETAGMYISSGKHKEALKGLNRAIDNDKDNLRLYEEKLNVLNLLPEEFDQKINTYDEIIRLSQKKLDLSLKMLI